MTGGFCAVLCVAVIAAICIAVIISKLTEE